MTRRNPIATDEQHAFERRAVELIPHPTLQATRAELRAHWLETVKPGPAMRACFEWAFEEVMFGALIWGLNQDPLHPGVVTISRLAHRLGELEVPGSRWGLDNPDSVYRVIPISGDERYRIHGRVGERRLRENYFTLWDDAMNTVDVLDGKDLALGADGSFVITVDCDPSGARPNHIRSAPGARQLYIRDVLLDWAGDQLNELAIERLGPPPPRPPFSEEEQVALCAHNMRTWVANSIRWNDQALRKPANAFDFRIDRDHDGALRNQIYILSRFELPSEDDALVFSVDLGGADYFVAPITNYWGTTNEIVHRNGSLNKAQAVADPDGSYTFVLCQQDPGVYNWLDPCDMPEGILTLRWAEFSDDEARDSVSVSARTAKRSALAASLPEGTRFVTPEQRVAQLRERAESYLWRLRES